MTLSTALISLIFLFISGTTNETAVNSDPGFREAIFDAGSIRDLIKQNDCDGIRVYNTLNGNNVELMAVPISKGADLNKGLFNFSPYLVSQGVNNERIVTDRISERKARERCEALYRSNFNQYAVDFNKSEVETLLRTNGANAVRITPFQSGEALSMQMEATNFQGGTAMPLGGTQIEATNPCPPYCGIEGNYVFTP